MATASRTIKNLFRKLSKTDSRKEYADLKKKIESKVLKLFNMVGDVCREVGVMPPWICLIGMMDEDKLVFSIKSEAVYQAEISCYGSKDVEIFIITATDGTVENDVPIELPWFDLGKEEWRKKLIAAKQEELEKEVAAAQIKLQLAQGRLKRFKESHL